MSKWEYVTVELMNSYGMQYPLNGDKVPQWKDKPLFAVLEDLGKHGWEFITFDGTVYILKRPARAAAKMPAQKQA